MQWRCTGRLHRPAAWRRRNTAAISGYHARPETSNSHACMKTLLVTGGAGFIGGNFVLDALAQGGWRIVNLDALTYAGNLDTLASVSDRADYAFEHGDIGDAAFVTRVLATHQPTAIVNFAAESH